jgi:hypothetical protein
MADATAGLPRLAAGLDAAGTANPGFGVAGLGDSGGSGWV